MLLSATVANSAKPDLSSVNPKPTDAASVTAGYPKIAKDYLEFSAKNNPDFTGRNPNVINSSNYEVLKPSKFFNRAVLSAENRKTAVQFENLESTSAEMVQKVEDDKLNLFKKQQEKFKDNRDLLVYIYDTLANDVDTSNFGKEKDPNIQNAFKCSDLNDCRTSGNDKHSIKVCESYERIHWNGSKWSCRGLFEDLEPVQCEEHQYSITLNGGVACVDYIYDWVIDSWGACDSSNSQKAEYICVKKRKNTDSGTKVADSKCISLSVKPDTSRTCR